MSKTSLTFVLLAVALLSIGCRQRVVIFEIPTGYVGWVAIQYHKEICADEKQGSWTTTITIDRDGSGCSKQWMGPDRLFFVQYFYVEEDGRRIRRLESTGWGEGGEIWAQSSTPAEDEFSFFVGSEREFDKATTGPGANRHMR